MSPVSSPWLQGHVLAVGPPEVNFRSRVSVFPSVQGGSRGLLPPGVVVRIRSVTAGDSRARHEFTRGRDHFSLRFSVSHTLAALFFLKYVFGCAGLSLLRGPFLVPEGGVSSLAVVQGFPLWWLLSLQSSGLRVCGLQC